MLSCSRNYSNKTLKILAPWKDIINQTTLSQNPLWFSCAINTQILIFYALHAGIFSNVQ